MKRLPYDLRTLKYGEHPDGGWRTHSTIEIDLHFPFQRGLLSLRPVRGAPDEQRVEVHYRIPSSPRLVIWAGFRWDGASGPTLDSDAIRRSALIHDALYRMMAFGTVSPKKNRKMADKIFREYLRMGGVNFVRRWYYYAAVRLFGKKAMEDGQTHWADYRVAGR